MVPPVYQYVTSCQLYMLRRPLHGLVRRRRCTLQRVLAVQGMAHPPGPWRCGKSGSQMYEPMNRRSTMCMKIYFLLWMLIRVCSVNGKPNFVVFMADDLGYGDLGFTGNTDVHTPYIDKLAAESVFLPNFYVSPVCTPTRASLLTGRHFLRTGVWGVHGGRDFMNLDESTFANVLSDAGYATAMFGKWHNGKTDGYLPWHRGFEEACVTELYNYFGNKANCNGQQVQTEGWVQNSIVDWSNDFIERKTREGRNFLLYIPFMAPHLGRRGGGNGETWPALPSFVQNYKDKGLSDDLSHVYALVQMMDYSIERILRHLDRLGIDNNTVIMFFSDNGLTGKDRMKDWPRRNHLGFRGEKGQVFENGIRSPLFVRWRGSFPGGTSAQTQLASVEDIFPTLSDLAGAGHGNKPVDGISLVSILYNPWDDQGFSQRTLYHTVMAPYSTISGGKYILLSKFGTDKSSLKFGVQGAWALREGHWKYVNDGSDNLFDLAADPREQNSVRNSPNLHRMREKLSGWWQEMLADGGSFTTPAFYIGHPGSGSGLILPSAAAEIGGNWSLGTHSVSGTGGPGQYLKYKVFVATPRTYMIKIKYTGNIHGDLEYTLACGASVSSTKGSVHSSGYVGLIQLSQAGQNCVLTMTTLSEWHIMDFSEIRFEPYKGVSTLFNFQSG